MKPVFFGSHATSTTFLRPSLRNWFWKPFSEMLLLKLLLLLLFRYVLLQKCDNFITKCDRYHKVRWLLQSAIEQTFKLKRSSSIDEQSGKNRWHRTLRPAKDWRGDTQKFIVICRQIFLNMGLGLGLGPLHQLPIQIFNYVYCNMSMQPFATLFGYHMANQ